MPYKDPAKRRIANQKCRAKKLEEYRAARRRRYAEHPEIELASQARYRVEHHEERKAYMVRYRFENHEKCLASQARARIEQHDKYVASHARYLAKYPKRRKATVDRYRAKHPERGRMYVKKHRAHKFNAPINDFTEEQWVFMQKAYNHRCAYCKKRFKGKLCQDHITPLSKGGSHTLTNIVPSCRSCNSKKFTGPVLVPVQPLLLTA